MKEADLIRTALKIMYYVHINQDDKTGGAQILHPLAVGCMGSTNEEKIVGFLHDVVEDSVYTFDDLINEGFSDSVITALRLLTHNERDTYEEYVHKIAESGNTLALKTKLHDLQHNIARGKKAGLSHLVEKHTKALAIIQEALNK